MLRGSMLLLLWRLLYRGDKTSHEAELWFRIILQSIILQNEAWRLSDEILIRAVREDDFGEWKPLWDGYNAFYGRKEKTALPDAITKITWSRFFNASEPVHALVAEQSGQLLGLAHFLFHRTTISIEPTCYMQDLFTIEAARGKGVGRALIEEVYRYAKRAGSSRMYWQTHETNTTAMKLYDKVAERSGFVVYRKAL
jgi:GNAT superfamily N-acetyltransferase